MSTSSKKSKDFRCGTVAILGRPNAGKSTLLNALLEVSVSPTSNRPQTTRHNIRGILQIEDGKGARKNWKGQLVLIDTPGINLKKGQPLDRAMLMSVEEAVTDVDIVVWVADSRTFDKDLRDFELEKQGTDKALGWMRDQLKANNARAAKGQKTTRWILVLSKADLTPKPDILPLIERAAKILPDFTDIVPTAAKFGAEHSKSNVDNLIKVLKDAAPEGEPLYDSEDWTDLSERQLVANLVREAVFQLTHDEVPYESDCSILRFKEPEGSKKMAEVDATIWVGKKSLKPILVGKQGAMIREINHRVRERYKEITGENIVLKLFVKVVENWHRVPKQLAELGYVEGK
jgi:GTP-binding protein Era